MIWDTLRDFIRQKLGIYCFELFKYWLILEKWNLNQ